MTETDLISRQAALNAMDTWDKFGCDPDGKLVSYDDDNHYVPYVQYDDMIHAIKHLPPAQPDERMLHESCTDCPLYDKDRHSCPRFNKVIPETLREVQSAQPERMTNRQWIDFLSAQFDISRTSAKEMLHGMMQCKKRITSKSCLMGDRRGVKYEISAMRRL